MKPAPADVVLIAVAVLIATAGCRNDSLLQPSTREPTAVPPSAMPSAPFNTIKALGYFEGRAADSVADLFNHTTTASRWAVPVWNSRTPPRSGPISAQDEYTGPANIWGQQTLVNGGAPYVQAEMYADQPYMSQTSNVTFKNGLNTVVAQESHTSPNSDSQYCYDIHSGGECMQGPAGTSWAGVKTELWQIQKRCSASIAAHTTHTAWSVNIFFQRTNEGSQTSDGSGSAPLCAPPKPKLLLSANGASGTDLTLTLMPNTVASVSFDGTGSQQGEDDGPALTGYQWFVNGNSWSTSATSGYGNMQSSSSVSLQVTDADAITASSSGSVTISFIDPCDDPLTHDVETCDASQEGEQVSVGGTGCDTDGASYGGPTGSELVCYVTDWFEWNGHGWTWVGSQTDYCDFE